ncbi:MAG: trigger factor [Burkholderiaceae bacterium]|nr:MAG: trigger factor [Burkholderiaceae bacterium]
MNSTIGSVETVSALERRISLAIPADAIASEVNVRLQKLSRKVKMAGFRPGKVPLKMVAQAHGYEVESEVVSDAINEALREAVTKNELRVAGRPRIEQKAAGEDAKVLSFEATFEVYPEVKHSDISALTIEKVTAVVGEAELDKTIGILLKQRVKYVAADRAAQNDDRLTIDFLGKIDGVAFAGGSASDYAFVLGQKQMLADFEAGLLGMKAGETKAVDVKFPEDYHGKDVAGKTAVFELTLKKVEAPILPELTEAFAKELGIVDGDVQKLRADVKENLERELKGRLTQRNKQAVLDALLTTAQFEVPKALVEMEAQSMVERARADMKARVMKDDMPIPADVFQPQAEKRTKLGLMVADLVKQHKLEAKPDQVKAMIEEQARSYDAPDEVLRWYYADPRRLDDVKAVVMEDNLMNWVLGQAKVSEKTVDFDELMAR